MDFMIMEATWMKVLKEDAEAQEEADNKAKQDAWKKDTKGLDQFR